MNLAQVIGELRLQVDAGQATPSATPVAMPKTLPRVKKADVIIGALRDGPLTAIELHEKIGGPMSSLSVYLCTLKSRGFIKATGPRMQFRYEVA